MIFRTVLYVLTRTSVRFAGSYRYFGKGYKCLCSYYIEDMSDNVCAFDLGSNSRKPLRLFLQKDGTFSTAAGLSRKKFKTKFFAKLKLRKYKNCILVKHILYHSVKGDFEDFMEELRVID